MKRASCFKVQFTGLDRNPQLRQRESGNTAEHRERPERHRDKDSGCKRIWVTTMLRISMLDYMVSTDGQHTSDTREY